MRGAVLEIAKMPLTTITAPRMPEWRRPLAQQQNRPDRGKQGTGAARQRIDQRKIADLVAALQGDKVEQLQQPTAG